MYLHIYLQTQAEKYISHFTVYLNLKYLMRLLYWNQRIYMLNWWRATTWNVLRNMFYTLAANISHYSHSRVTTDVHLEWIFFYMFTIGLTLLQLEISSRIAVGAELGHCLVHLQTPDSEGTQCESTAESSEVPDWLLRDLINLPQFTSNLI